MSQADEVLVVDNGSPGGEAAAIARAHGASVVALPDNRGFTGGANAGLDAAHGDVVALLNDDAVAAPGWIAGSTDVLADGAVAAVAPKVLLASRFGEYLLSGEVHRVAGDARPLGRQLRKVAPASAADGDGDLLEVLLGPGVHGLEHAGDDRWRWTTGAGAVYVACGDDGDAPPLDFDGEVVEPRRVVDLLNAAGSYLRRDGYAGDCGENEPDDGQWDAARRCFAASGAALVTTAAVLRRVGGFAPGFFAYYEDTDWCWRARLMGYEVAYDPSLVVRHVRGLTSGGTGAARVQFLAERNRLLTLARCAPLRLALDEARKKRRGGGSDGVAEILPGTLARALAQRVGLARHRSVRPAEVYERWAGVDAPRG